MEKERIAFPVEILWREMRGNANGAHVWEFKAQI